MRFKNKINKFIKIVLMMILLIVIFTGCGTTPEKQFTKQEDFVDSKIGVLTGSSFDLLAKEYFPESEKLYQSTINDLIISVRQRKIDGVLMDKGFFAPLIWEEKGLSFIEMDMPVTEYAIAFPKSSDSNGLKAQVNEFIKVHKENGWLDSQYKKWFSDKEPLYDLDYSKLTGENGTIRVATTVQRKPFDYLQDNQFYGYDAELIFQFAYEYGYSLEINRMDFNVLLSNLNSGKYDLAISSITVTEERKEAINFSDSYCSTPIVMGVYKEVDDNTSFWEELKEDFEKTFIREDRWKLLIDGVGVTILITICSVICGSMLGFVLYVLSCSNIDFIQNFTRKLCKVYTRIISGTPVVVILMILFYVVFAKARDVNGILVATIGFTLIFGSFVYEHLHVSVNSVDNGQTEAAYALGYSRNKTFFRIVLPQALKVFLPTYCSRSVEMIKSTAVVGFIAVNDLTKVGDIIRSNTLEAFFPLISTAVIYFFLTWIFSVLLKKISKKFEPKRRKLKNILKGVEVDD